MALVKCVVCDFSLLTEADPYSVFPMHSGYHVVCLNCLCGEPHAIMNEIHTKILEVMETRKDVL